MPRKILALMIACILLVFQVTFPVFADNEISIVGEKGKGLYLYSDNNDIFRINNAAPGREWTTQINIVNTTKEVMVISLSQIKAKTQSSNLPSYMYLRIYREGETLYDGSYPIEVSPVVKRIEIQPFDTATITAKCGIEASAGNEIQNATLETSWVFDGVLENRKIDLGSSNTYSSGKSGNIAIPSLVSGLNAFNGYDIYCYDSDGNILLVLRDISTGYNFHLKAPYIEGYEAEREYIPVFEIDGKIVNFTYHEVDTTSIESNNGTENSVNLYKPQYTDDAVSKPNATDISSLDIHNDNQNPAMMDKPKRENDISKEQNIRPGEENNDEHSGSSLHILLNDILTNTRLVTWWTVIMLAVIAVLAVIILRKIYNKVKNK